MRIPIYQPSLGAAERRALLACFDSGWISHRGPEVARFEAEFAEAVGAKHAVAVSSGTAALHCALVAAGVKPGDEVVVPALTYIATANAVVHAGAKPVFADVDAETWCLTPETIQTAELEAGGQGCKAVLPVHLYGHPIPPIMSVVPIIEDCAEALSTKRIPGADAAAWSFFANKTITTGEGGMVTTNSEEVADSARRMAHQGLVPGSEYRHDRVGYNYRMTAFQAAIGRAQLRRLPSLVRRKREIAEAYRDLLAGLPVKLQADHPGHAWWLVSITDIEPRKLRPHLAKWGIETRPVFPAVCCQPAYYKPHSQLSLPNAHRIGNLGISLPSFPALTAKQINYIVEAIRRYYR